MSGFQMGKKKEMFPSFKTDLESALRISAKRTDINPSAFRYHGRNKRGGGDRRESVVVWRDIAEYNDSGDEKNKVKTVTRKTLAEVLEDMPQESRHAKDWEPFIWKNDDEDDTHGGHEEILPPNYHEDE